MAAHARLGPSSADRWMVCAASVRLIERLTADGKIDPRSSSGAADEGTAAHQIRGDALELGLDAWDFIGTKQTINGVDYLCDEEMAAHLQPGMDWVNDQPGDVIVEHRVDLGRWMPGQFGTLDTAIIQRMRRRAIIDDLKYGAGVPVDAIGTRQLRIYGIGVLDNFDLWDDVDEIVLVIDQPRAGGMKFWTQTTEELLAFAHEVKAAALRVDDPAAPFVPGDKQCGFCPAKWDCEARQDWIIEISGLDLDDDIASEPQLPARARITPERRWWIVRHSHLVEQWFAKLHEDSIAAAKAGSPDPGSKLVLGRRGNRRYTDEQAVEELLEPVLGDDAFTRKVLSVSQVEKLLKPGRKKPGNPDVLSALDRLVTQDAGKPILVPDTDDRPAITPFDDLLDDD